MIIVAICGVKRSGKDTIAHYLTQKYSYQLRHVKIAAPLKEMCGQLFGWSAQQMEDDSKDLVDPVWGVSPRSALQFIGTEVMQYKIQELLGPAIDRKFWILALTRTIQPSESVVISDMRFVHEYNVLKEQYGNKLYTIKVVKSDSQHDDNQDLHSSEQEWKSIPEDVTIDNNGTLQDLYKKLDELTVCGLSYLVE